MPDPIHDFLATAGWDGAERRPLAGDASTRVFTRLTDAEGQRAILMQSPGTPIAPFQRAAAHFQTLGLSVPAILAADPDAGLLLVEDFGDAGLARLMDGDPAREPALLAAATDVLIRLHRHPPPAWAERYGPAEMADALAPFVQYVAVGDAAPLIETMRELLERHAPETTVLLHRDYHAENLILLPDRDGSAAIGMIDFQDALAGHPAYDLVSLLQDARRDVPDAMEEAMVARYVTVTGTADEAFRTAYALQGAQRHLRILGIFARLAAQEGKGRYLRLVPRVRRSLDRCLAHPAAGPLRDAVDRALPE